MVRLKHRYLLVNILYTAARPSIKNSTAVPWTVGFRRPSPDNLTIKLLVRIIRDGLAELFGDYGSGTVGAGLKVIYFSPATSTAIIRAPRAHYRLLWAALSFTTKLPHPVNDTCVFQVVRVSGTIRKVEEEAIRRARLQIRMAERSAGKDTTMLPDIIERDQYLPQVMEDFDDNAESFGT